MFIDKNDVELAVRHSIDPVGVIGSYAVSAKKALKEGPVEFGLSYPEKHEEGQENQAYLVLKTLRTNSDVDNWKSEMMEEFNL